MQIFLVFDVPCSLLKIWIEWSKMSSVQGLRSPCASGPATQGSQPRPKENNCISKITKGLPRRCPCLKNWKGGDCNPDADISIILQNQLPDHIFINEWL